ncbi:MAG: DUF4186 domain-containing protein [Bacilli bacterium]|nr:DUF4186 domain-containing protein [Bacilli bacterium]
MNNKEAIINNKLEELSKSKFRSSFHLNKKMKEYVKEKGYSKISVHAYDFLNKNLKPENPINDGKQTPMKNHPVFIAQHATGCCCRSCLYKWHHIEKGVELTDNQINYLVLLIMKWIDNDMKNS